MKWLTRISVPSLLTVLLTLSTSWLVNTQASASTNASTKVQAAASTATQTRYTYLRYEESPRRGPCKIIPNPSVPSAAFTVFGYLLTHNYSPPPYYKGNTPYGNTTHKLPDPPPGYGWFEYDVYSGSYSRSPDRIVTARNLIFEANGYPYFTPDHYESFVSMYICKPPVRA